MENNAQSTNKRKKIVSEQTLNFMDAIAVVHIFIVVILGIHIYFWGVEIIPFSFCRLGDHWSVAWVYGRFAYFVIKRFNYSK